LSTNVDVKYVEIKEEKERTHKTRQQTRLNARRTTLYKKKAKKREERSSFLCKIL